MALRCILYKRTHKIVLQRQIDIVQGGRQQDGIASVRLNRKSTWALVSGWGREEGRQSDVSACSWAKRKKDVTHVVKGQSWGRQTGTSLGAVGRGWGLAQS